MTSILTNNGAMVALQTLKGINNQLGTIQEQISTGKKVGTAKDNASLWALSKVMEADVSGFNKISDGLAVGKSTVAVARDASEQITEKLREIRDKIIQAQDPAQDRAKIHTDITKLKESIDTIVGSAQFNGVNLVDGKSTGINVLSSLDRDASGNVTSRKIDVAGQNLSTSAGTTLSAAAATITNNGTAGQLDAGAANTVVINTLNFQNAAGSDAAAVALAPDTSGVSGSADAILAGDRIEIEIGTVKASYTVREGDVADSVLAGIKNGLQDAGLDTSKYSLDLTTSGAMTITNNTTTNVEHFAASVSRGTGGLAGLDSMDVTTTTGATAALDAIEGMIQTAVDASSAFGTSQNQLETQAEFVSKLSDNLKAGIGSMVDADMEEASARLQALQVQQQLGVQSLSIANQAPQSVLSLFR